MREITCSLFSLTRGEEFKVFLFALTGFLWSLAASTAFKFADALFVYHIGAHSLSTIYMCIPVGMILMSTILLNIYHRVAAHTVFLSLIFFSALLNGISFFFYNWGFGHHPDWFWYVLRIQTALIFYPLIASYWNFVDQYFRPHDARRLFGIFSSTVFLGVSTTGMIMRWGLIPSEFISPFIVVIMICAACTIKYIVSHVPLFQHEMEEVPADNLTLGEKIKAIFSCRFSILIILGNLMAIFMWVIAEYNYMSTFEEKFAALGETHLTEFLGQCLSIVSIVNVIFGIFMYARLVRKFGVESIILFTPVMYLLMFSGWLYYDMFLFPLMGYFIVEGSTEIIDNSNFGLLIRGIPAHIRPTLRVLINSIFEPLGMLFSGITLTFISFDSRILGMLIACFAVTAALFLRSHQTGILYPSNLKTWLLRFVKAPAVERS